MCWSSSRCIAGHGIALGWSHLTDALVKSGMLVRVTGHHLSTGKAFYVAWPKGRHLSSSALAVRDWLIAQQREGTG